MRMSKMKVYSILILGLFIGMLMIPSLSCSTRKTEIHNIDSIKSVLSKYSVQNLFAKERCINGNMHENCIDGDVFFEDYSDDVLLYRFEGLNNEIQRTNEKQHINIINGSFMKKNNTITLNVEVMGEIENRGNFSSLNNVIYSFAVFSSENQYNVDYCNHTCVLYYDNSSTNLTSFFIEDSKLSITYPWFNPDEIFQSILISAFDLSLETFSNVELCLDLATNREYSMEVEITKPDNNLYWFNKEKFPVTLPVIVGNINVEYEEILNETDLSFDYKELYIDDILTATPESIDNTLIWDTFSFGKHTLEVLVFDAYGNRASDSMDVWKFF